MKNLLDRKLNTELFDENEIKKENPFGYRLAPIEIWKGSKLERSLVTTLGQGVFEQIGKLLAEDKGNVAQNQYNYNIEISDDKVKYITKLLDDQRTGSLRIKELNENLKELKESKKLLNGRGTGKIHLINKKIKELKAKMKNDDSVDLKKSLDKLKDELLNKKQELETINKKIKEIQDEKKEINDSIKIPVWKDEIRELNKLTSDKNMVEKKGIFDLYIKRKVTGVEEFYSFKTVKPNLDQTEIAKRDMLYIKASNPQHKVYFALPYNPAGEKELYKKCGHKIPYKLFDMDNAESVLIGAALWNTIADDKTAYDELLKIFNKVGKKYSEKIKKDYLKIKI